MTTHLDRHLALSQIVAEADLSEIVYVVDFVVNVEKFLILFMRLRCSTTELDADPRDIQYVHRTGGGVGDASALYDFFTLP